MLVCVYVCVCEVDWVFMSHYSITSLISLSDRLGLIHLSSFLYLYSPCMFPHVPCSLQNQKKTSITCSIRAYSFLLPSSGRTIRKQFILAKHRDEPQTRLYKSISLPSQIVAICIMGSNGFGNVPPWGCWEIEAADRHREPIYDCFRRKLMGHLRSL